MLLALSWGIATHAQTGGEDTTRTRRFVIQTGAGVGRFASIPGVPAHLSTTVQLVGPNFMGRAMWYPEYKLRVGIESGWTTFYSYRFTGTSEPGRLQLSAIPLLGTFSMPLGEHLEVYAGFGTYRLISTLDLFGRVRTAFFSQGYSAALAYRSPIGTRWNAAVEMGWMNAFVTGHHLLALRLRADLRIPR